MFAFSYRVAEQRTAMLLYATADDDSTDGINFIKSATHTSNDHYRCSSSYESDQVKNYGRPTVWGLDLFEVHFDKSASDLESIMYKTCHNQADTGNSYISDDQVCVVEMRSWTESELQAL